MTRTGWDAAGAARDFFAEFLYSATEQAIIATDPNGQITVFNTGAEQMLGYTAQELLGRTPELLHDPAEIRSRARELGLPAGFEAVLDSARQGRPETRPWTYLTRDGRRLQALITVTGIRSADGAITGFVNVGTDVTELRRSRDLFAGVLDAATEQSIIATDASGIITVFNTGAERMLGHTAAEMVGSSPEFLHDPAEISARAAELGIEPGFGVFLAIAARGEPETRQWTYLTKDGRRLQALITVTAMHGPTGELTGFIKVGTDITELEQSRALLQTQTALRESEERFRNTFQHAPNGMMLVGMGESDLGRLLQVNPALCVLTGYSRERLIGMSLTDLTAEEHRVSCQERLVARQLCQNFDSGAEERWLNAKDEDLWVLINLSPRTSADDPYVIGQINDITARKDAEVRLNFQALHDGLTGLPNRNLLMDRIVHALAGSTRSRLSVAVFYLDLDGFKAVNDTAGHAAGDLTLVDVARRLKQTLRPGDTVSRLGGDEFVVICEEVGDEEVAAKIAERILFSVKQPFHHAGHTFTVTASIGVSLSIQGSTAEQMLHRADKAMYVAKNAGKGRVQIGGNDHPDLLASSARAMRAIRIEGELQCALDCGELVMFGQPVVDLQTGDVVAVENLVRWRHPVQGLLGPADFLDVAEASDLMVQIGRRALEESCRMAATWTASNGRPAPPVHVNISGRQLELGNLKSDVEKALDYYSLPPERLVLELTETHMPMIADSLLKDLMALRDSGVQVALDDLGTGYSSLTRITELPVDMLKIDLRFVGGMLVDTACAAVVRGILSIGQALGMSVVAEGVETADQADQLFAFGCATAQGYLYSRPLAEDDLAAFLAANQLVHSA